MRQSELVYQTYRHQPEDELALNAIWLWRAGFIEKISAGVYALMPLGLRVVRKIEAIVRQELNRIGAIELILPALHPQELWQQTNRWQTFDALFKTVSQTGQAYALGPTHEEVIFPLMKKLIQSYKDLPRAVYQLQTKFRDELRPKSGILRTREFLMKDLYSFHRTHKEVEAYMQRMVRVYSRIFKRCGLKAIPVWASGGAFSPDYSIEFQVEADSGEDLVFYCDRCRQGWNREIFDKQRCRDCGGSVRTFKAIEVGNLFNLGTGFSEPFELFYNDRNGSKKLVYAGCYGIGITRAMGAVVETHNDENGIIWPREIAPFQIHLLSLWSNSRKIDIEIKRLSEELYQKLSEEIEVLYDDRDVSAASKLVEADLIGCPLRLVISAKTLQVRQIELKERYQQKPKLLKLSQFVKYIKEWLNSSAKLP
jgi:prolyl-tRNA synthetase